MRRAESASKPAARPKASERKAKGRPAELPDFRPVQLALLTDAAPEGNDWLHEVKYDGCRVEIALGGDAVRFSIGKEQDWTTRFASLTDAAFAPPCRSALSLAAAVQMGALEFHIWGSHNDAMERPDRLVFDLDPDPSVGFEAVREAAVLVRGALEAIGLSAFPMVTGGKGVHVVVPQLPKASFEDIARFAKGQANRIAASDPAHFVVAMSKAKRRGRIFINWLRNEQGQTAVAPSSTRARAGAPVATLVS